MEPRIVRAATAMAFLMNWFLASNVMIDYSKEKIVTIARNVRVWSLKEQKVQRN